MKTHKHSGAGPSQRQLRVGEQLRHIIAETLQRGHFHSEALLDIGRLSITDVRVTPDLKHAKAYILSLGGDEDLTDLLKALNAEAASFQKEVNRQSNLKFTPKIRFVQDESFENAQRIDRLLRDVSLGEDS